MREFRIKGALSKILQIEYGTTKAGDDWRKIQFIVTNNDGYEGREQLYAFQIFGEKYVDNFLKYNKEGATVEVKFNIQTNEYQGKYYTNLQAYRVESLKDEREGVQIAPTEEEQGGTDSTPF